MEAAVEVTVVDAAVVVVSAMDAAVAVIPDAGVAIVVVVATSVLLVDSNARALPDGSLIAATTTGMSSVVKGLGAVRERWLRFGSGNSAVVLCESSDDWETTRDRRVFFTTVGRAVTPVGRAVRAVRFPILDMVARACAHALIF